MRARVNQYESVTFRGIRHHQGAEFDFDSMEEIASIAKQVTVIEAEKVQETHNEEEA